MFNNFINKINYLYVSNKVLIIDKNILKTYNKIMIYGFRIHNYC